MKAGRELDALIAEKVMGTPKYWSVWFACSHYGNFNGLDQAQAYAEKIQGDFKAHVLPYSDEPNYSTSIEAAWEVVRKMGMVLIENSWEAFGQADEWNVQFVGHDKEGKPHWVSESAETVEIAICLAALKAKGGDA